MRRIKLFLVAVLSSVTVASGALALTAPPVRAATPNATMKCKHEGCTIASTDCFYVLNSVCNGEGTGFCFMSACVVE